MNKLNEMKKNGPSTGLMGTIIISMLLALLVFEQILKNNKEADTHSRYYIVGEMVCSTIGKGQVLEYGPRDTYVVRVWESNAPNGKVTLHDFEITKCKEVK